MQQEDYYRLSHETNLLVVYDEKCWFCRTLAQMILSKYPHRLRIMPWSDFRSEIADESLPESPQELAILFDSKLHFGQDAWNLLIQSLPALNTLDWLARKAGVTKGLAPVMEKQGQRIRKLCFRCR